MFKVIESGYPSGVSYSSGITAATVATSATGKHLGSTVDIERNVRLGDDGRCGIPPELNELAWSSTKETG